MTKPRRIQRQRTKDWKMPHNTVYVGRGSKWGNPYRVGIDGTATECVEKYRLLVLNNIWTFPAPKHLKEELRGKNLACWCKPGRPCHATIMLKIANAKN